MPEPNENNITEEEITLRLTDVMEKEEQIQEILSLREKFWIINDLNDDIQQYTLSVDELENLCRYLKKCAIPQWIYLNK